MPTPAPVDEVNPLTKLFMAEEIWNRVTGHKNTAPEPDGIRYHVWKRVDSGSYIADEIFNTANQLKFILRSWNISETVLILKKGFPMKVTSW